ncbi:MAG TPA: hypothetical protein VG248_17295 [Caulobacteraceae bacterium]|jgi:hypothetical protein|nr:hypothetical protein [Caulobacteraceae bacterium]
MYRDLFITVHRAPRGVGIDVNPLAIATMAQDGRGHAVLSFIGGALSITCGETPEEVKALIRGEPMLDPEPMFDPEQAAGPDAANERAPAAVPIGKGAKGAAKAAAEETTQE